MKIRDGHATINGDKTEHEMPSGCVDIIADDGRSLFSITKTDHGIEISCAGVCKHNGKLLNDRIILIPRVANTIIVKRPEYA